MTRIIDLTATIGDPRIPVISFFPPVILEQFHTHEIQGRSNSKLSMPIHVGTHMDAPYHFVPDGITIDKLPLKKVIGRAVRLDVRERMKENTPIVVDDIKSIVEAYKLNLKDKIAIIQSGWAQRAFIKLNFYIDNPFLAIETSHYLVDQGIKALALDHPIELGIRPGVIPHPGDSPNHRYCLSHGIPLIENLVNLETFNDVEFGIIAMPAKVFHCDGAPARVIAVLGSWNLEQIEE